MSEHESASDKPRDIGLKAIHDVRAARARSKHGRITGRTWLVVLSSILVVTAAAFIYRERSLATQKDELLAKQRAAVAAVGVEWFPLRDAMEKMTLAAVGPYTGDRIDPEIADWNFRSRPGIYLRMRLEDARDVATLRKAAKDSARDAFVACLLRPDNPSVAAIARGEADAGPGWDDQPWNMRLAYHASRVFTDEWAGEVKDAEDEIHLRIFAQQYEKAETEEIPLAIGIIKKAEVFTLVLDEDVPEASAAAPTTGPHAGEITEEALQQVRHPARVLIVNLKTGKEMVRLRREAEGEFRLAGEGAARTPHLLATMKRQVNNCALAQTVSDAIGAHVRGEDRGIGEP